MSAKFPNVREAEKHLAANDPTMASLIEKFGRCQLWLSQDYLAVLVRAIIAQLISTKAAHSIFARLFDLMKPEGMSAPRLLDTPSEMLRSVGLSSMKQNYIRNLSQAIVDGNLNLSSLETQSDEAIIEQLKKVKGIGRWTAEMFLMFALGRPDVLPVGDLGLVVGIQREYELPAKPKKTEILEIAEPWRPYGTVATWYIWRTFGDIVPQSRDDDVLAKTQKL